MTARGQWKASQAMCCTKHGNTRAPSQWKPGAKLKQRPDKQHRFVVKYMPLYIFLQNWKKCTYMYESLQFPFEMNTRGGKTLTTFMPFHTKHDLQLQVFVFYNYYCHFCLLFDRTVDRHETELERERRDGIGKGPWARTRTWDACPQDYWRWHSYRVLIYKG